jgi:diaminohydroxyphosphoribosylaminopyrimidine deaminase/5-amino-6-(5-phosphoribosylamino)uracil reductase
VRVVLDSRARFPLDAAMLDRTLPGRTLVLVGSDAPGEQIQSLTESGAEVVQLQSRDGFIDPEVALRHLASRGINSVLVEGGGQVHGSLLDAGLIDRIVAFVAPVIIGGAGAPSPIGGLGVPTMGDAPRLSDIDVRQCGDDVMIRGRIRHLSDLVEELRCSAESSKRLDEWSPSRPLEATTR